ncbi:calcium-binding protein [Sulfurospirillum sp. 1612]|uniref:calcium-binding protein n=1 Tax=Sulfurospirillum sp. 1612 TaxID=3094835 RepID=UPI002F94094A
MATVVETYLDNAIAANVAYGDLTNDIVSDPSKYFYYLADKKGEVKLSSSQAKAFAGVTEQMKDGQVVTDDKGNIQYKFVTEKVTQPDGSTKDIRTKGYTILSTYSDPNTGYYGVLFKDNTTGKLTISNRGTQPNKLNDLLNDTSLVTKQVPEQFNSMATFMNQLIDEGKITKEDDVTMTGHSAGGTLTQMGTAAYSEYIDSASTQNSPGAKDLNSYVYEKDGQYYYREILSYSTTSGTPNYGNEQEITEAVYEAHLRFLANKDSAEVNNKITNIKADNGPTFIADLNEDIGKEISVLGSSHSLVDLVQILSSLPTDLFEKMPGYDASKNYKVVPLNALQLMAKYFNIDVTDIINANPNKDFVDGYLIFNPQNDIYLPAGLSIDFQDGHPIDFNSAIVHMSDPLVLDTDKDGFISTISLQDSETYFDINGDGVKDKTSWIKGNDALLVYDKNEDGQISGIDEVFGNDFKSGFDELRDVADSNYDNKIDRRDALFNRLQVWHDYNGNGKVDDGELKSLKDEGITSINLNSLQTTINLDGAILTEASHYLDTNGNQELAADLELEYTSTVSQDNSNYDGGIDIDTVLLPQLRGYGYVGNTLIDYNTNTTLETMAKEYAGDINLVANHFDDFLATWSGFYDMAATRGIAKEDFTPGFLNVTSIKLWMLEHFSGNLINAWRTEVHLRENTNGGYHITSYNDEDYIKEKYNELLSHYQGIFALQAFYEDKLSGLSYDLAQDQFVIADQNAFDESFVTYMNDTSVSIDYKIFLAETLNNLKDVFINFDFDGVLSNIEDDSLQTMVQSILNGQSSSTYYLFDKSNINTVKDITVIGDDSDDIININSNNHNSTIIANQGNDKIITKNSNDTYIFNRGDGVDTIYDTDGEDKIKFTANISKDDISFTTQGDNLVINIANSTDTITIIDFGKKANRIEKLTFANGDELSLESSNIISLFVTEGNDIVELDDANNTINALGGDDIIRTFAGDDTIYGGVGSDTIDAGNGDDTLIGGAGDDTLQGGSGNDIYIFAKGDGKDVITDSSGNDTLKFADGITKDDLIAKANGNDMIIGIKEDGVDFADLSDTITIKNYLTSGLIENIKLSDDTTINLDELQSGTEGDDYLAYGNNAVHVDALGGADTIISGNGDDVIVAGEGDDIIRSGNGANNIDAGAGDDVITSGSGDDVINAGSGDDTISAGSGNNTVDAGDGADIVTSGSGADTLIGGAGDDTLSSGYGADTLQGGRGDDLLQGGLGDDTYIFNRGDGADTIDDSYTYGYNHQLNQNAGNDTLKFGNGISADDLVVRADGADMIIGIKEDGVDFADLSDTITLRNYVDSNSRIENIMMSDGGIISLNQLISATEGDDQLIYGDDAVTIDALGGDDRIISGNGADILNGGSGNDHITSGNGDDVLDGADGNDILEAGAGNDTLKGGAGDDTLQGGSGADTLSGGSGNDLLQGGLGDDTYLFNRGDGVDVVYDAYQYGSGGNDTLIFGDGISQEDLIVKVDGSDLLIGLREDGKTFDALNDIVRLQDYFNPNNRIETLQLSDGSTLTLDQLQKGTQGDDTLYFDDNNTTIDALGGDDRVTTGLGDDNVNGGAGNDILITGGGDDVVKGEDGDDILQSGSGDDMIYGGAGSDTINAGDGNDTLQGGSGADTLYGGAGHDTYLYAKGDGHDTINDTSGNDTLKFAEGITKNDLIAKANGNDLIIAIKEDGVDFDALSDKIIIKNYLTGGKIENFLLANATTIALDEIEVGTEESDYLAYGDEPVTVDALSGDDTVITGAGADIIDAGSGNDTANSGGGADTLQGGEGDDVLNSAGGNDSLQGGAGNDVLNAGTGDDTLEGGTGVDTLKGGLGNDIYVFNKGDGKDKLSDEGGTDTIKFGDGISKEDLIFKQVGYDLILAIKEDGKSFNQLSDNIKITNYFRQQYTIETLKFSDGSEMSSSDVAGLFVDVNIQDTIFSAQGATLRGGAGDDTYVYNRGDFTVVVDDNFYKDGLEVNAGNDTLRFATGITKADVSIGVNGANLIIKVNGDETYQELQDIVVIKDWQSANRGIEKIIFSDGEVMNITKTEDFPTITFDNSWTTSRYYIYGNDNDEINGTSSNDTIESAGGEDIVYAGAGNDIVYGGDGNDIIDSGAGNDRIIGGAGDDYLKDNSGDDVYVFNRGDGRDFIKDTNGDDKIYFGDGITKDDIVIKVFDNNLAVGLKEGATSFYYLSDRIVIKDWYVQSGRIESFEFSDGTSLDVTEIIAGIGTDGDDTIFGLDNEDTTLNGGKGNDTLNGKNGNDTLNGGIGNDIINSGVGNDTLDGGVGNDSLDGGAGDDTYIFAKGMGKDTIVDSGGNDTLQINSELTKGDMLYERIGDDLVFGIKESGKSFDELSDTITIKNWFNSLNDRVETVKFSNGETITANDILVPTDQKDTFTYGAEADTISALGGDDYIESGAGDDVVNGDGGNDTIYGQDGNDTINGGEDNDTLYGGNDNDVLNGNDGDDTLYGGKGTDVLYGGTGNDTYVFGRGDGADTIYDYNESYSGWSGGNDTLKFAEGISADDILIKQVGSNLVVALKEDGKTFDELSDKIRITNWSYNDPIHPDYLETWQNYHARFGIDNFTFSDGTAWTTADIMAHIGTDDNDVIFGLDGADTIEGGKGDDTLYGRVGDDTYVFNRGDGKDTIYDAYRDGNAGNDTLKFGEGITQDDLIFKKDGNNVLVGIKEDGKTFDELSDVVTMQNWYNKNNRIENFELSDGTVLGQDIILRTPTEFDDHLEYGETADTISALGGDDYIESGAGDDVVNGDGGNDTIYGQDGNDTINGGEDNDTLYGGNDNDVLNGNDGDDTLYGNDGDDTLYGGKGTDVLYGGTGNDTYVFGRGDGADTIYDYNESYSGWSGGNDTLKFAEGISADDILIKQVGSNLVVALKEDGKTFDELSDKIRITNWSYNDPIHPDYLETWQNYHARFGIDNFTFSDGTAWTTADIMAHIGTDDNDVIFGLDGADTIEGGKGDDTLYGRVGDDTYVFNRGDGKDTIYDAYRDGNAGNDTLKFGEGITQDDLIFKKDGNNVLVGIKEDGKTFDELSDVVTMQNWYNKNNRIENFELSDGTVLGQDIILRTPTEFDDHLEYGETADTISALGGDDYIESGAGDDVVNGDGGNDTIYGQDGNDTINGGEDNDTLYGGNDNDVLNGNDGDDTLYGNDGDDTLYGGKGTDVLYGGTGNDTYVFGRGDGADTIYDYNESYSGWSGGNDTLKFAEGISADDILIKQVGSNLVVALKEDGKTFDELSDKIRITNWSYNDPIHPDYLETWQNYHARFGIDNFTFSDGTAWTTADIMAHIGTDDNDVIFGLDGADTIEGGKGDDTLYGRVGDDTYVFNRGDGKDTIYDAYRDGNAGNDTLKFGEGITQDDLAFWMDGGNLQVDAGNGDTVTINSQINPNNAIEKIELANGSYLTNIDLEKLIEDLNLYTSENNITINSAEDVHNNAQMMNIIQNAWRNSDNTGGEYTPPIVVDLNGDKVTSVAMEDGNVYFDYDGDGIKERTAWTQSGDALLAMDLNGDGIINNGSELFGNYTKLSDGTFASDGYAALAQYDSNHDNIIDANDSAFASLKLWKDVNNNGITDSGELTSLQLSSITAIYLYREDGSTFDQVIEAGNIISNQTNYTTQDTSGLVRDIWFQTDSNDTITNNETYISTDKDESFSGGEGNDTYIMKLGGGKDVIDDNDPTGLGVDTIKFADGISPNQILVAWDQATNGLLIGIRENGDNSTALRDLDNQVVIKNWFANEGKIEKFEFSDGTVLDTDSIYNKLLAARDNGELTARVLHNDDTLIGGRYNDVLFGASGNELLKGGDGDDYLSGQAGDDKLMGGNDDDTLNGNQGDDILMGESGDDYYIFERGDGHDIIIDSSGNDTLMFGSNITRQDILAKIVGDDIIFGLKEEGKTFDALSDTITIKNYAQSGFEIETVLFDDGSAYHVADLLNQAPILESAILTIDMQDIRVIADSFKVTDPDNDPLSYTVRTAPANGNLTLNSDGTWSYEAIGNYIGADSAVVQIDDGNGGVVEQTLNFNLRVSAPSIDTTSFGLQEDTPLSDNLSITNPVGGALTYEIITPSANGTFSIDANGNYSYDPKQDYNGDDAVIIKVTNAYGLSTTSTLSFAIEAVNDAPVANMDSATTEENTQLVLNIVDILANDTDVDTNDTMNIINVAAPVNRGNASLDATTGEFLFDPGSDFDHLAVGESEEVSVAYTIADSAGATSTSEIIITVTGTNDRPVLETLTPLETQEDAAMITGIITSTDVDDGATATYSTTAAIAGFTLNSDGSYSFNPADNAYQSLAKDERLDITIPVTVTDDQNATDSNNLIITVIGTNDVPTVEKTSEAFTLTNIRNIDGQVISSDVDGDTLNYSVSTQAEHGTVSVDENGKWTYKVDGYYMGEDSAVITVDDGNGGTITKTLNFNALVSAPTLADVTNTLDEDTNISDALHVTNPIGGALTYEIIDNVDHGVFTLNPDGTYSYTPNANYNGDDILSIRVTNEYGLSSVATIDLSVTPVNDAPVVSTDDQSFTLTNIRNIDGQVVASDIDDDTLNYSVQTQAQHGTLSVDENGKWHYKADGSYNGDDSAVITVDDGNGGKVTSTLNFTVKGYIYEGEDLVIDDNGEDTLVINTINKDDLGFSRDGADLQISVQDQNTIILKNYFTHINTGVNTIITAQGALALSRDVINDSQYGGFLALDSNDHLISGDDYSNWLIGNRGNDIVFAGKGNDYISGGDGDNMIFAGEGDDNINTGSGNDMIYGDDGSDQIYAGDGNDTLIGGKGDDTLFGQSGDDTIYGGEGNDTIYSDQGNDTIAAGAGDDFIDGSYGSDTYLFNKGDGNDTVVDTSWFGSSDVDKIVFGAGITQDNLQIIRDDYDLVFKVDDNDSMRVKYWFASDQRNTIEQLNFSDGSTLDLNAVNSLALTLGSDHNDWISGLSNFDDHIYAKEGNDFVYSFAGNDFLSGGKGDDFLEGGSGSDTYVFDQGDGHDTVNEWASCGTDSDVDTIKFSQNITQEDVSFALNGTNLLIQYGQDDMIKVTNTYNANAPIERMELSNGNYLTNVDMNLIIQQMSAYGSEHGMDNITNNDIRNNADLMQIVSSGWHSA